jgi:hypothetical protein
VTAGMAHPERKEKGATIMYKNAGTNTPPDAAKIGSAAFLKEDKEPTFNSCLISNPTIKKNKVIRPSLIQNFKENPKKEADKIREKIGLILNKTKDSKKQKISKN